MNKEEIKGLSRIAGWIFVVFGMLVVIKGFLDIFILFPSSEFVSIDNWIRYALFEVVYGIACMSVGLVIFKFINAYLIER